MQPALSVTDQSDVELVHRARTGDQTAAQALLSRHRSAVEDLPASPWYDSVEASGRAAVALVRSGRSLDLPFRAIWLAVHARGGVPEEVSAYDQVIWSAFGALPAPWRVAVWQREVEGQRAREIAPLLAMSKDQVDHALVSSYVVLKRRAALAHTAAPMGPECERLVSLYRTMPPPFLTGAEARALREHNRHCDACLDLICNLLAIERTLRHTLAHLVMGPAAEGYLTQRPQVARLRVASAQGGLRGRRIQAGPASMSAVAVGAVVMAFVVSSPTLFPSTTGPATAQGEVPILGATLQPVGDGASPDTSTGSGSSSPGDEATSDGPAAGQADGQDDGPVGAGPGSSGDGAPEEPNAPEPPEQPGPPGSPPPPGNPPPPGPDPQPDPPVAVDVTPEQVTVTVNPPAGPVDPVDPVEVEVPLPQAPATLPDVADDVVDQVLP